MFFLTSVSDVECNLIDQRLKQIGIKYLMKDFSQNAAFRVYGAHSFSGKTNFCTSFKIQNS